MAKTPKNSPAPPKPAAAKSAARNTDSGPSEVAATGGDRPAEKAAQTQQLAAGMQANPTKLAPSNCSTPITSQSSTCSSNTRGWPLQRRGRATERRKLAAAICHRSQEEAFYPTLREAVPDAAPLLDEAQAEHQKGKDLIASIEAIDRAGPQMDELVAQLACLVEHHVKEERDELFPKGKTAKAMDLADLGAQLRERTRPCRRRRR